MRITFAILIIITLNLQSQDTAIFKKNFIYIKPFVFSNDVMELNDLWLTIGYDRLINKKNSIGFYFASIFKSSPSSAVFYGPSFNAKKTNGIRLNIEWKYFCCKKIYISSNLLYQKTTTHSEESIIDNNLMIPIINQNAYLVNRDAISILPKIGVILKKRNKKLYIDLSIGIGLKYITSATEGKIGKLSLRQESYSGKKFEQGSIWTYHPAFHIKTGLNF